MALSITLSETDIGIPMADTYARIVMWRGDKDQTLIQVAHYANADARQANAQPVANRTRCHSFNLIHSKLIHTTFTYFYL
jgi:hypothetical protein